MATLTTLQMHLLDQACIPIAWAYGEPPYLVGSSHDRRDARDIDVRLILPDDQFDALFPKPELWEVACMTIGHWLASRSGLPVDFQIQRMTEANAKHRGPRNPLGTGHRRYAGLGDGTPWSSGLTDFGNVTRSPSGWEKGS